MKHVLQQTRQAFGDVLREVQRAKMRTALTAGGMVIGVGAVFLVMSVGRSAQDVILDQVRTIGANVVAVLPGNADDTGPPAAALGIVTKTLTTSDLEALRNPVSVPHLAAVSGYVRLQRPVSVGATTRTVQIEAVSQSYIDVEEPTVSRGRFFGAGELSQRVVVLGADTAEDLFGDTNPIGQTMTIARKKFRIIGVFAPRGSSLFSNPDTTIYVPLAVGQKALQNISYLDAIRGRVDDERYIERTMEDMRILLRARHRISDPANDDFSVRSIAAALDILGNITSVLSVFLTGVAAVSLFVGGVGVMNTMFMTLSRRIREIGLRKSLGARRQDVFVQFILTSVALTTVGGFFGLVVGMLLSYLIALGAGLAGFAWTWFVPYDAVAVAAIVSVVIGILFGLYPAVRASRVTPIDALRYE